MSKRLGVSSRHRPVLRTQRAGRFRKRLKNVHTRGTNSSLLALLEFVPMACVGSSLSLCTGVSVSGGSEPAKAAPVPVPALASSSAVETLLVAAPAISCESCPHAERDGKHSRLTSLLRVREVSKILGISRSTIYAHLQQRADQPRSDFPRPIRLIQGQRSSVRWRADEIQAWIDSRHRAS